MRNCPNQTQTQKGGFQGYCHNCGIWGHAAAQCSKTVNEINDQQDVSPKEDSDTLEVSWGGINAVEEAWKEVCTKKTKNEASKPPSYAQVARGLAKIINDNRYAALVSENEESKHANTKISERARSAS